MQFRHFETVQVFDCTLKERLKNLMILLILIKYTFFSIARDSRTLQLNLLDGSRKDLVSLRGQ